VPKLPLMMIYTRALVICLNTRRSRIADALE